jgi:hypothetical protein
MRKLGFIALLIGITALSACSLGGGGVDTCDEGGALFADDFSGDRRCGWLEYNDSGAVVDIADGALRLSTSQPGQIYWTNPGRSFSDVIITVQARQVEGPNDNAYGVICRYQDPENFYLFLISGDGYYTVGKYQSGQEIVTYLTQGNQFAYSDSINQGIATNQLRVACIGDQLELSVNGLPLFAVNDSTFSEGDVGLGLSILEVGTAVVEFDDFRVLAP